MQYQGGKARISKEMARVITETSGGGRTLVSLFCGACSVESKCTEFSHIILNDSHEYLIAMLKAVQEGWVPPDAVTEEQYKYIRDHKDEDKALTGFVGFGCSFGGRFFEGYARNRTNKNYAAVSKRSLLKDMKTLADKEYAEFICGDYRDLVLPDSCVIYADPPYVNTKQISRQSFDTQQFWDYARETSKRHLVFISEQTAPDDFVSIWEKDVRRTLDVNKSNNFKATEHLFVHKRYVN